MPTDSDFTPSNALLRPAPEVTAHALRMEAHDDEVGDLLIALLGFDTAVLHLAASDDARAGRVLLSVVSWLLLD